MTGRRAGALPAITGRAPAVSRAGPYGRVIRWPRAARTLQLHRRGGLDDYLGGGGRLLHRALAADLGQDCQLVELVGPLPLIPL